MDGNFRRDFAPVNEGEEYDVNIEGVGEKGDGIARIKGFVVFIPGVKEGDAVRVKISRVLRKVGFAEVVGEAQVSEEPTTEQENPVEKETQPEKEEDTLLDESKDSEDFGEESTEEPAEEETKDKKKKS